jgi:hypothetical protein
MSNKRTTTPFALRTRETLKLPQRNSASKNAEYSNGPNVADIKKLNKPRVSQMVAISGSPPMSLAMPANADAIMRSTSFKCSGVPVRRPLGCTYYGEGFGYAHQDNGPERLIKPKSGSRKKRTPAMQKTAANWNIKNADLAYESVSKDYSNPNVNVSIGRRTNARPQANRQTSGNGHGQRPQHPSDSSTLARREPKDADGENDGDGSGRKEDQYIRYIKHQKKLKAAETGYLARLAPYSGLQRRLDPGAESPASTAAQSFVMSGISYEVHHDRGASREHLKGRRSKDMNLMFYDFNNSALRMASESPQPHEESQEELHRRHVEPRRMVYPHKTSEHFYRPSAWNKSNHTGSTFDGTVEKPSVQHQSMIEEDETHLLQSPLTLQNQAQNARAAVHDSQRTRSPPPLPPPATHGNPVAQPAIVQRLANALHLSKHVPEGRRPNDCLARDSEGMAKFRDKILSMKSHIQEDINELSSEDSYD